MQEPRRLQSPRKGSAIYGFLISISPSSLNQFSGKGKHTPCMVRADCVDGLGTMEKTQREDSSPMSSGHRSPQGQKPGSRVTCRRTQQHRLRAEHPRARCWGPHRKPSAVHSPERGSSGCLCSEPVSLHKHVLAGVCVWGEGWREGGRGATWGGPRQTREAQDMRRHESPRTACNRCSRLSGTPCKAIPGSPHSLRRSDWEAPL